MKRIILILLTCSIITGVYIERALGPYGIGLFQPNWPLGVQIDWMSTYSSGTTPYIHVPKSLVSISNGGSVVNDSGENLKIEKVYSYTFDKEDNSIFVEVATNKKELHYVSFYKNTDGVTKTIAIPKQLFEQNPNTSISEHKWVSLEKNESIDSMLNVSRFINYAFLIIMSIVLVLLKRKSNENA